MEVPKGVAYRQESFSHTCVSGHPVPCLRDVLLPFRFSTNLILDHFLLTDPRVQQFGARLLHPTSQVLWVPSDILDWAMVDWEIFKKNGESAGAMADGDAEGDGRERER